MAAGTAQLPKNPLLKRIGVEIDKASWTGQYAFPGELAAAKSLPDINFASALLWMGVASLVQTVPRWWTAIRWAQAKYAYAVDSASDLRLHPEMVDLEKHQKSVLSDEWGIGVALEWLTNVFQYRQVCRRILEQGQIGHHLPGQEGVVLLPQGQHRRHHGQSAEQPELAITAPDHRADGHSRNHAQSQGTAKEGSGPWLPPTTLLITEPKNPVDSAGAGWTKSPTVLPPKAA